METRTNHIKIADLINYYFLEFSTEHLTRQAYKIKTELLSGKLDDPKMLIEVLNDLIQLDGVLHADDLRFAMEIKRWYETKS